METIDIRFDDKTLNDIRELVGQQMQCYKSDAFVYAPSVYGIVGFCIGDKTYSLTNFVEPLDYYGKIEDVAVYRFSQCEPSEIHSYADNEEMIRTSVDEKISAIRIINENQQLFYKGEQTYDVFTVRGIIFQFESGYELSLEKNVWFSEMITIMRGTSLMDKFVSTDDFTEGWEGVSDYEPKCYREVVTFGDWK